MSIQDDTQQWLAGPDVGASSRTLIRFLAFGHVPQGPLERIDHPYDVADFARCVRALERLSELRSKVPSAHVLSAEWANLCTQWDALEALYREELPTGSLPKTDHAIRRLLDAAKHSAGIEEAHLLDGYEAPQNEPAHKTSAIFVLDMREVNSIVGGRSVEAAALMFKALDKDYSKPCSQCGRKRKVVLDSVYPPTPEKDKCHECCSKNAVSA